jgi:PAS domain S-box-containing protein
MQQEFDHYQDIKEKILNSVLHIFAVFVFPLLVSSVLRFSVTGWIFVYLVQIIVVSLFFTVYFLRNFLSLRVKSIFVVCITLVIALLGIKSFGYIGPGILYFIISILIANLFLGRKQGYYLIAITAIAFLLFGYFFIRGKLVYNFDLMNFLHLPFSWISYGLVLFPVILIIIITINKFEDAYQFLIKDRIKREENYRAIFEQAADGIIIYDGQGNILMSNKSFSNASGYQTEELKKMNISDFFDAEEQKNNPIRFDLLEMGEIVISERKVVRKDKTIIDIESRSQKLPDGRIQSFIRDITEKKRIKKEIYIAGINAEELERGRLAKDLHEGLGPLLSACKIYLHKIKNKGINDEESFNKLEEIIDESLRGIKEISNTISPHILRNFGLIYAIKSFIEKLGDKFEIDVIYDCNPSERFDEIIEVTIYRVLIELINNTIKYAKACKAAVLINVEFGQLCLEYREDGIGFDYNEPKRFGLLNIKSRIESIGGHYEFLNETGKGVFIRVLIDTKIR